MGSVSLSFRRRLMLLFLIGTAEFHVLPLAFGAGGMIYTLSNLHGEWLIPLSFCLLLFLPLTLFGGFASWFVSTKSVDIGSLDRIVAYGEEPRTLVFLPAAGPPLLTLDARDWPKEMPAEIGEHVGVAVDCLGAVGKRELGAKYPGNYW